MTHQHHPNYGIVRTADRAVKQEKSMIVALRDFISLVTMVAAISTAAWAQEVSPAAGPTGSDGDSARESSISANPTVRQV
jgi:hypothetical protein